jgi:hypothetical protein
VPGDGTAGRSKRDVDAKRRSSDNKREANAISYQTVGAAEQTAESMRMLVMSKGALGVRQAETYYHEKYSHDDYYTEQTKVIGHWFGEAPRRSR